MRNLMSSCCQGSLTGYQQYRLFVVALDWLLKSEDKSLLLEILHTSYTGLGGNELKDRETPLAILDHAIQAAKGQEQSADR